MKTITSLKGYDFEIVEELDANIWKVQQIWRNIKFDDFNNSDSEKTFGDYQKENPFIFITAYSGKETITASVNENDFEITIEENDYSSDFDDGEDLEIDFLEDDFIALNKSIKVFLKDNKRFNEVA